MSLTLAELASALTGKPVDTPPAPAPVAADHDALFLAQYATVAAAVGYAPPELELQRFKALCSEHGICCYDRAKVKAYLDEKYGGATQKHETREIGWSISDEIETSTFEAFLAAGSNARGRRLPRSRTITRERATWGWRPLRSTPTGFVSEWRAPKDSDQVITSGNFYIKPIPLPVLLTAQKIREVTPSATFYVSDEIHEHDIEPVRDPFLAVQIGADFFIVERWDEPGFRP